MKALFRVQLFGLLIFIVLILFACKKDSTNEKYCTKVISNFFSSAPGGKYVLIIKDKVGNSMEIVCTSTDYQTYPIGSTVCLDKNYNIWRG